MSAKIFYLSPKGSAWLVYHRCWKGGGSTTDWAFVYNFHTGLTAHEAWSAANLKGNPPFYEVIVEQLEAFSPGKLSVDTNELSDKAMAAFEKLRGRVHDNPRSA